MLKDKDLLSKNLGKQFIRTRCIIIVIVSHQLDIIKEYITNHQRYENHCSL